MFFKEKCLVTYGVWLICIIKFIHFILDCKIWEELVILQKIFFSQIMFSIVLLLRFLNKCTCLFFTSPAVVIYNVKMARVCHVYDLPGKLASEKKNSLRRFEKCNV